MLITNRKVKTRHNAIKRLAANSILIALAYASMEMIWPVYLHNFFPNSSTVGFITAFLSIIGVVALGFLTPLFKKYPTRNLFISSIAVNAIIFSLFALTHNATVFFLLAVVNMIFNAIRIQSFGILTRENTTSKNLENDESLMYVLANIGWVAGPLIAGFIAEELSPGSVLIMSALFMLLSLYNTTMSSQIKDHHKTLDQVHIFKNLKEFFSSKKRIHAYILSGGLEIWYELPYIFIPLELINRGFGESAIGIFLFLLCIPHIIIQYYIQKHRINEKKFIAIGYALPFVLGLMAVLTTNIYIVMGLIILASFGLGMLEPLTETHFFHIIKKDEDKKYYGPFMTSKVIGGFFGRFSMAFILLVVPFHTGIGLFALFMGACLWIALGSKK